MLMCKDLDQRKAKKTIKQFLNQQNFQHLVKTMFLFLFFARKNFSWYCLQTDWTRNMNDLETYLTIYFSFEIEEILFFGSFLCLKTVFLKET